jgi:solute carrier family 45 protein 1/2/4
MHLPVRIRAIFGIQFFAWLGWFNMLFYSSTWYSPSFPAKFRVGEVYARHQNGLPSDDDGESDITDTVGHIARIGSMALVVFSCVTLISSVLLPPFVRKPDDSQKPPPQGEEPSRLAQIWQQTRIPTLFHLLIQKAQPVRPSLTIAWVIGHGLFAFAMFCAPLVQSVSGATFVVGLCGLPWAVTCWAPFALLGDEIAKMGSTEEGYEMVETNRSPPPSYDQIEKRTSEHIDGEPSSSTPLDPSGRDSLDSVLSAAHSEDIDVFNEDPTAPEERVLRLGGGEGVERPLPLHLHEPAPTNDVAGEMLGIMNVFVTLPQFIMTFVSSVIFAILEPGKSKELTEGKTQGNGGVSAIAVVMVIGGVGSLVALWLTLKLRKLS